MHETVGGVRVLNQTFPPPENKVRESAMSDAEDQGTDIKKDAAEAGGEEVGGSAMAGIPPKIPTDKRFLALLIDIGVTFGIGLVGMILTFGVGLVSSALATLLSAAAQGISAGYLALRDSLNDGRSVGKKIMKLTVQTPDGQPCTQEQSLRRNAIIALPTACMAVGTLASLVPFVGWMVQLGLGLFAIIPGLAYLYEGIQVLALDPNGRRLMELKSETYTVLE
jgi:uncharacterized RDD family membrane protein YckC